MRRAHADGALRNGNAAVPLEGISLAARGLTTGYAPHVPVVVDLDLEVRPGEVVALLGANGAGKTTTLLALAGELPLHAGEVVVDGEPSRAPMHRRAREGMSFVTEERSVFMSMSVADNLRIGSGSSEMALELFPELRPRLKTLGGLLSGGEQQMLSLARALSRKPRVLLADELSLGLAPMAVHRLLRAVRAAADDGAGVLLVEQHVRKALEYADRGYVLQRGRIAVSGSAVDLGSRIEEIERAYLHTESSA